MNFFLLFISISKKKEKQNKNSSLVVSLTKWLQPQNLFFSGYVFENFW